jgi:hypothetical protein
MELFHANKQWSTRPADQEFKSVQAMYQACRAYADTAVEADGVQLASLRVENMDGDLALVGRKNIPARLTNWAFGQLAARVGAPAGYLETLPATLAAQNLNHGLAHKVATAGKEALVNLLFHRNGEMISRSINGERYSRFWNWEVCERLLDMERRGYSPARPDIRIGGLADRIPLYASDHDMFAFLAHADRVVREPGNPDGLRRGIIVSNSEVGAGKLRVLQFLYRAMCGNHIIWGAEDVLDLSLVHVGDLRGRMRVWQAKIDAYMNGATTADENAIAASKSRLIASTKEEVLDAIFGKRSIGLSRKMITAGYDACLPDVDGDPRSPWGLAQGLTRASQETSYTDKRMDVDKAAGRILVEF